MSDKQASTFSLTYSVRAMIRARPEVLWARLTDAAAFPSWNTTVSRVDGTIAVGQKLAIQVPIAPGRTFTPKVTELEPGRRMVWSDGFYPMFRGRRTFTLTPGPEGTEFVMEERFEGLMLPMIKGSLPDFGPVFDQYAADLARACEGGR
jgi:hypothetical protein